MKNRGFKENRRMLQTSEKVIELVKKCAYCKEPFELNKHHPNQAYCSNKCSKKHRRAEKNALTKDIEYTCEYCGDSFKKAPRQSLKKYCSIKCNSAAGYDRRDPDRVVRRSKTICACGTEFTPSHGRKNCSRKCVLDNCYSKLKTHVSELVKTYDHKRLVCKHCGNYFYIPAKSNRLLCSPECATASKKLSTIKSKERIKKGEIGKLHKNICIYCNTEFESLQEESAYCTRRCRRKYRNEHGTLSKAVYISSDDKEMTTQAMCRAKTNRVLKKEKSDEASM